MCTEREHYPGGTSEMCTVHRNRTPSDGTAEMSTVHRNRTLSRPYIRNVNCAQKQNPFQTVHHKCVLCTETEHFPDGTSELWTVH